MKKVIFRVALTAVILGLLAGPHLSEGAGEPVDPRLTPQWTRITTVQGVEYASNLKTDVFRYQGSYYCYDGRWHRSSVWGGSWTVIPQPPQAFYQIEATYFKKVPPGWSRGRKTGWRGGSLPPGQAKKAGQPVGVETVAPIGPAPVVEPAGPPGKGRKKDKGIPPGQLKKMY